MAKLNQGLSLNQMQLLAYTIFSTQKNSGTNFRKYEFQNKFNIKQYRTEDAYRDSYRISLLQFTFEDLKRDKFSFTNIFSHIEYSEGIFLFEWNKRVLSHILEIKEKFVLTDLTITSNFRSSFSWVLYDYLKANYGYKYKTLDKDELLKLFVVENKKTYINSTAQFKRGVLDVAVREINKYTEIKVDYEEVKKGRKIIRFKINWTSKRIVPIASKKQRNLLEEICSVIDKNTLTYMSLKMKI